MSTARLVLDYIRVFIWPVTVVTLGLLFRVQIGRLIDRIRKGRLAGAEVELAEYRVEAALEAADVALAEESATVETVLPDAVTAAGAATDQPSEVPALPDDVAPPVETERQRRAERTRRRAVEKVLHEGVRFGFERAQAGDGSPPSLLVDWDATGKPMITGYGQSHTPGIDAPPPSDRVDRQVLVRRLEREIRDEEERLLAPGLAVASRGLLGGDGRGPRLKKLKAQLRALDPNSPLGLDL